jgi:hypothetical protein
VRVASMVFFVFKKVATRTKDESESLDEDEVPGK